MDLVEGTKTIRLRSRNSKYLVAGRTQSVRLDRDGSSKRARWRVEFVEGKDVIRLKSCFGKYLTAGNEPLIPRYKAHKVLQTLPEKLNSSTEWEIERCGKNEVKLKTSYGLYLRPYGGLPPFRNKVGHETPCRTQTDDKIQWVFEILERVES